MGSKRWSKDAGIFFLVVCGSVGARRRSPLIPEVVSPF